MALRVRICPGCKSENVQMANGGITGIYACKDCGYSGSIFPEKLLVEEMEKNKVRKK